MITLSSVGKGPQGQLGDKCYEKLGDGFQLEDCLQEVAPRWALEYKEEGFSTEKDNSGHSKSRE